MSRSTLAAAVLASAFTSSPLIAAPTTAPAAADSSATNRVAIVETPRQHEARMAWWRAARFGMFIHWGSYAVAGGYYHDKPAAGAGEWIQTFKKIPVAEYAEFGKQFKPVDFDASKWVSLAKAAGMKYIVITAKHHEGFAMYHTAVDDYNIYDDAGFHRDPLKELAEACRKQGMKLGFYYSQAQDWHHTGGAGAKWDHTHDGSMDDYIDKVAVPQVREILSNYGPVCELWWDTAYNMNPERAAKFIPLLKLQPDIIMNNRLGGGYAGDLNTPEQHIPPTGFKGRDWETCMTINDTWGYKKQDTDFKSAASLLHNLIDIASKGGNYLLNVGPDADGRIPQPEVERLQTLGKWLDTNGEAIYGTTASPFTRQLAWGRCTQKPGKLFLSVFNWPTDGTLTVPITAHVTGAALLADASKLSFAATPNGVKITLPSQSPDANASVVVLDVTGPIVTLAAPIPQDADHSFDLEAATADLSGAGLKYLEVPGSNAPASLTSWNHPADTVSWPVSVTTPGSFAGVMSIKSGGDDYDLTAGAQTLAGTLPDTKGEFKTVKFGPIALPAGETTVALHVTVKPDRAGPELRFVTLKPAKN